MLSENPLHDRNIPNKRIKLSVGADAHIRDKSPRRLLRHVLLNGSLNVLLALARKELLLFLLILLILLTRRGRVRADVMFAHPVEQLAGNLLECFARQAHWIALELVVGDELHDVRLRALVASAGVEHLVVAVQPVHRAEVGGAHAHDHDREGQHGGRNYLLYGLVHVADLPVRQDEQNVVLLRLLAHLLRLNVASNMLDDFGEVGGTGKLDFLQRVFVGGENAFNTLNMWVANVPIEREAVRCSCLHAVARHFCTVAIQIDLVIAVVVLEDLSHVLDCIDVLVLSRIEVMQRGLLIGTAVRRCEVYGD